MKIKSFVITLPILIFAFTASAQQGINYKAINNDANGNVLVNTKITVEFTILENGTNEVYRESHTTFTDNNGIIIVNIGEGSSGAYDFSTIDWGSAPHFLKTEIDKGDGITDLGTTEFKTVPYALHAKSAATPNLTDVLTKGADAGSKQIKNIGDPTEDQDAATKTYVDALQQQITALEDRVTALEEEGGIENVTDVDGNTYSVVVIGTQVWMAENLKTTKYNDGSPIPLVTDNSIWANLSTPAYCWYDNDQATFGNTYGALYNWYSVKTGQLCPTGWHVTTEVDWTILISYLGGESIAGGKLKETGTAHWEGPNPGATNETGFTAIPGGFRDELNFIGLGESAIWWTSDTWVREMYYTYDEVNRTAFPYQCGFSIRCLKD